MLEERRARLGLGTERRLRLRLLADLVIVLLQLLHVRKDELRLDDLRIPDRIDRRGLVAALLDVDDVVVLEAPDDVQDRVALADVREELVAEALALRRTLHEARDVRELHGRADHLRALRHLREHVKPLVDDLHDRTVRLDRAERIVLRRRLLLLRERIEQGRLADVRQTYDTN